MALDEAKKKAGGWVWLVWLMFAGAMIGAACGAYFSPQAALAGGLAEAEIGLFVHKNWWSIWGWPAPPRLIMLIQFFAVPENLSAGLAAERIAAWWAACGAAAGALAALAGAAVVTKPRVLLNFFKSGE